MSQRSPALLAAQRHALRCLAHPASLAAIGLLLANDHWLKQAHPSALTGKLSDLAGLLFFPFLLAFCLAWLPGLARDELRLGRLSIAITGLWFAGLQLSPLVEAATMRLVGLITGHDGVNVRDATDLVALAILWPAWRIWTAEDEIGSASGARAIARLPRKHRPRHRPRLRPLLGSLALVLAGFATLATTQPEPFGIHELIDVAEVPTKTALVRLGTVLATGLLGAASLMLPMLAWTLGLVPRYWHAAALAAGLYVALLWRLRRNAPIPKRDASKLPTFHMGHLPEIDLDKALSIAEEDEDAEVLDKMEPRRPR